MQNPQSCRLRATLKINGQAPGGIVGPGSEELILNSQNFSVYVLTFLSNPDGSTSSGSNDSDSSEGGGKRRKNFEVYKLTESRCGKTLWTKSTSCLPSSSTSHYLQIDKLYLCCCGGSPKISFRLSSFVQAFVMTGDRMINLAKTPANADWKSK